MENRVSVVTAIKPLFIADVARAAKWSINTKIRTKQGVNVHIYTLLMYCEYVVATELAAHLYCCFFIVPNRSLKPLWRWTSLRGKHLKNEKRGNAQPFEFYGMLL